MNGALLPLFLCLCILVLLLVVFWQQFAFRVGTQAKLKQIHEKLKETADTDSGERLMVFTDNRELMELAAQINRLLEERSRVKADYRRFEMASKKMLSNISHDIKTPMTVVLGYLEIMRLHGEADPGMLARTEQKAQSVMELINQFFTLAKIEAGDMDLKRSRIDLSELCRESVLDFYEILSKSDVQVEIDLPKQAVFVQGDREALQRILFNLVSNAVRYGSAGKYLGVVLYFDETYVYVEVVDHGQGIEKSFADRIFDRLFTMEDSRSRSIQGNGLGLTIAKNLALQMDGDITLESIPHVKTTFTLRLKYDGERNL